MLICYAYTKYSVASAIIGTNNVAAIVKITVSIICIVVMSFSC